MKKFLSIILPFMFVLIVMPIMDLEASALDYRVEAAIQWAVNIANDDTHGYSQANRTSPNYDCSSLVSFAFKNGGFPVKGTLTTSTMTTPFVNAGFTRYKKGDVTIQRGDILLKAGSHVELYLGGNKCVSAHSNYDGKSGDSSGREIAVRDISKCSFCKNKGYTHILRYEENVVGMLGDVNLDGIIDIEDAIQVTFFINFPDTYYIGQPTDFDNNNEDNIDDAIYLLFYIYFPERYPLPANKN